MITGRWEFAGAFLRQGSSVGPTHTFRTAEEFIALNDDDENARLEWSFPAARTVTTPCASRLDLRADGGYEEHEEADAGPHLWPNGGTRHEPVSHGTWERVGEDGARLVPHDAREKMAPLYFDEASVEPSGQLHRSIVTVVDGVHVDFVRAYYRPAGTMDPSPVDQWVAERIDALEAFTPEKPPTSETQLAVWEVMISARMNSAWACSRGMIATMRNIRSSLAAIPKRRAPYKSAMTDAVARYFDVVRATR